VRTETAPCTVGAAVQAARRIIGHAAACVMRHPGRAGGTWSCRYRGLLDRSKAHYERQATKLRQGGLVLYIAGPPEQIRIITAPRLRTRR
jgi:hypothetical protein